MSHAINISNIRNMCYVLYQLDWKVSHNITPEREIMVLKDYLALYPPQCYSKANPPEQTFEQFLEEMGYQGELYVSFEEFLDCEYKDIGYIKYLLKDLENHLPEYEKDLYELLAEKSKEK